MFRIGEFSALVRVSARMLRHYEKCGLLAPAEVDPFTGYRMYAAAQIPLLNRIVKLRDAGFRIDEILNLIEHDDDQTMLKELKAKRLEVERGIAREQDKLDLLAHMLGTMKGDKIMGTIYEVELKSLPAVNILSTRQILGAYDEEGLLWHKLGHYMAKHAIPGGEGGYSLYLDEEYKEKNVLVEVGVPVEAMGADDGEFTYKTLPAIPEAATVRFKGPYDQYAEASAKLAKWMEDNGYAFAGTMRGQSIVAPGDQRKPENYLTELQVPVVKK